MNSLLPLPVISPPHWCSHPLFLSGRDLCVCWGMLHFKDILTYKKKTDRKIQLWILFLFSLVFYTQRGQRYQMKPIPQKSSTVFPPTNVKLTMWRQLLLEVSDFCWRQWIILFMPYTWARGRQAAGKMAPALSVSQIKRNRGSNKRRE